MLVPSVAEDGEALALGIEALEPESGRVLFAVRERADSEADVLPALSGSWRGCGTRSATGNPRCAARTRRSPGPSPPASRPTSTTSPASAAWSGPRMPSAPGTWTASATSARRSPSTRVSPRPFRAGAAGLLERRPLRRAPADARRRIAAAGAALPPRAGPGPRLGREPVSPSGAVNRDPPGRGREFPEDPRLAYALAEALFRQGRVAEAVPHLERAVELDPGFELAVDSLVWYLGKLDRVEDLKRVAGQLAASPPSTGRLVTEARALGFSGDVEGALQVLRRAAPSGTGLARDPGGRARGGRRLGRGGDRCSGRMRREIPMARATGWSGTCSCGGAPARPRPSGIDGRRRPTRASDSSKATQVNQFLAPRRDLAGVRRIVEERGHVDRERRQSRPRPGVPRGRRRGPDSDRASFGRARHAQAGRRTGGLAGGRPRSGAGRAAGGGPRVNRSPRSRARPRPPPGMRPSAPWRRRGTSRRSATCAGSSASTTPSASGGPGPAAQPAPRGSPAPAAGQAGRGQGGTRQAGGLLSEADADHPLLSDMRALRRKLGAGGRSVAAASDPGRPNRRGGAR